MSNGYLQFGNESLVPAAADPSSVGVAAAGLVSAPSLSLVALFGSPCALLYSSASWDFLTKSPLIDSI